MRRAELLKLLEHHALGRAWLLSLRFALRHGHCESHMASDLLDRACVALESSASAGHVVNSVSAWQSVAFAMSTSVIHPDRASLHLDPSAELTHVTTLVNIELYHFDGLTEALSESTAFRPGTDQSTRFRIVKDLLSKLIADRRLAVKTRATIGLQRLWVTPGSVPLGSKRLPEQAGETRDERGLIHLGTEHFLVAYAFDAAAAPSLHRPTALDAVGTRFRPWSNLPGRHEPMGTAVNLARFADGNPDMDGVAEGLTPGFALTESVAFCVVPLGNPKPVKRKSSRGQAIDGSDSHDAFANRLAEEARDLGLLANPTLHEQLGTLL